MTVVGTTRVQTLPALTFIVEVVIDALTFALLALGVAQEHTIVVVRAWIIDSWNKFS